MGNSIDFDLLFRQNYIKLYLFAMRFLNNDEDCHDLVEDAFEEAWQHYAQIDDGSAVSYLYTCLRRKCIDRLRRQKVEQKYIRLQTFLTEQYTTVEGVLEIRRREEIIERSIEMLPDTTRRIFTLCYVEHKRYQEVADILNISINTVKKHISKALKLFSENRTQFN